MEIAFLRCLNVSGYILGMSGARIPFSGVMLWCMIVWIRADGAASVE